MKKKLIHKGTTVQVVEPAEYEETIQEDGSVRRKKIKDEVTQKVKLPPGSSFGNYAVGVAYEIDDPEVVKSLIRRGFEEATDGQLKKSAQAASTRVDQTDKIAEADRKRALENQSTFEGGETRG